MIGKENQIKYGFIKEVNFKTIFLKNGQKKMIQKCIQHTMKENLFFAERFIRTFKTKFYKYMASISKNAYIKWYSK